MMLVISVLLALVPLLGIAWIVFYGSITTVDGLFMSLIMAAMSGIVALNVLIELRKWGSGKQGSAAATATAAGGLSQRGKVQSVQFYESGVGQPNKSIVTLTDGGGASNLLVLEGDMRNALPVGQRVLVTFRKESGHNVLVDVDYP
ncbi:MAG: hypothetical protein WBQ64_06750 [Terriglobales bacterium]|jgi:hypothetical protein